MTELTHPADEEALSRILRVKPIWTQMRSAADAIDLAEHTLLHAGPAFKDPAEIVKPVLNSACVAAVFNGLAPDFEKAEDKILNGAITLRPAQDYNVVTPLAGFAHKLVRRIEEVAVLHLRPRALFLLILFTNMSD